MNEETIATIKSSIKECDSHVAKIDRAKGLLEKEFPLTEESFTALDETIIEHIDQLIYRFAKLQDSMGTRLLPSLYSYIENDDSPKPFISIMQRLEQLDILTSLEEWQFFRNLRNNLAHDYRESIGQTVETLNALYDEIGKFKSIFQSIHKHWKDIQTD